MTMGYFTSGYAAGKTYKQNQWLRLSIKHHVIGVQDRMLDSMILMGIKPSQITLASEIRRPNFDPYNVIWRG